MYIPKHFSVPAKDTLQSLFPEASFASLVTADPEGVPFATHLPFIYDATEGDYGTLTGHMARANPHWQYFDGVESLVILSGPHAYISPRYYASDVNVPTWNYVAVHAYGKPRIIENADQVKKVLDRLTLDNEAEGDNPWSTSEMEPKRLEAMMRAIVAFEISITRLDAKAKLGQNKSEEDQASVRAAIGQLWEA